MDEYPRGTCLRTCLLLNLRVCLWDLNESFSSAFDLFAKIGENMNSASKKQPVIDLNMMIS